MSSEVACSALVADHGNQAERRRWTLVTGILAVVIAFVGLGLISAGASGVVFLLAERADRPVTLRDYAIAIEMIGIGAGLLGIAQGLRILLLILAKVAVVPPL